MFSKNLLIATVIATLILFSLSFVWYDLLMGDFYQHIDGVNRNPVIFPLIIFGFLIFSYAFCRLYLLSYTDKKPVIGQAINYGILIGLISTISYGIIQYATRLTPTSELLADGIFNFILTIIAAIAIGLYFGEEPDRGGGVIGGGRD